MYLLIVGFLISMYISMYLLIIIVGFFISYFGCFETSFCFFFWSSIVVAVCNMRSIWKGIHLLIYLSIYLVAHVFQLNVFVQYK